MQSLNLRQLTPHGVKLPIYLRGLPLESVFAPIFLLTSHTLRGETFSRLASSLRFTVVLDNFLASNAA